MSAGVILGKLMWHEPVSVEMAPRACHCIGPQGDQPACPCVMRQQAIYQQMVAKFDPRLLEPKPRVWTEGRHD